MAISNLDIRDLDAPDVYKLLQDEEKNHPEDGKLLICKSCGAVFDYNVHKRLINRASGKKENRKIRLGLLEKSVCRDCSALYTKRKGKETLRKNIPTGSNHPKWRGGISFDPYCSLFNDEFRERVRNFWKYKCGICGKTEKENGRKLSVHHVNYDKQVCCNNNKPLFIPLCHSHHRKTNRNREYWEEMFTTYIMIWFDGECYNPKQEDKC